MCKILSDYLVNEASNAAPTATRTCRVLNAVPAQPTKSGKLYIYMSTYLPNTKHDVTDKTA